MSYLRTPDESPLYAAEAGALGYIPNYLRVFALCPDAYVAWRQLVGAVKAGMDERRYELATVAAAIQLRSTYCCLAHAKVLVDKFHDARTTRAIVENHHDAGLDPVDVAIIDFAGKVAADPNRVTADDAAILRAHGLSDVDIMQVVLAATIRRFFSAAAAAVGAQPDNALLQLDPELRAALDHEKGAHHAG